MITYPLNLPIGGINAITLSMAPLVGIVRSEFTLASQVQEHQGMLWGAAVSVHLMKREEAENWLAFFAALSGRYGTFLLGDPFGTAPRGSALGTPAVDGASQTGKILATKDWTPSALGVLLKGDYIQLGSSEATRLYKVVNDVDADTAGGADIDIWPRLRESPSDSELLVLNNAKGTFRLSNNLMNWDEMVAGFYSPSNFMAEEAI